MPADAPIVVCARLKVILEDAGICKVVGRADAQSVEVSRTSIADAEAGKEIATKEVDVHVGGIKLLGGARVRELTDKPDSLLPGRIGGQTNRVVEREDLAACMQRLGKAENLAHRERTGRGIILKIVFGGEAVFDAEQIVNIPVDLVCAERARRSSFWGVATQTVDLGRSKCRVGGGDHEFPSRAFGIQNGKRNAVHIGDGDASERGERRCAAIVGKTSGNVGKLRGSVGCVRDSLPLVRTKEE